MSRRGSDIPYDYDDEAAALAELSARGYRNAAGENAADDPLVRALAELAFTGVSDQPPELNDDESDDADAE